MQHDAHAGPEVHNEYVEIEVAKEHEDHLDTAETVEGVISVSLKAMHKAMGAYQARGFTNHSDLINIVRDANLLGSPHVSELYSPPRIISFAQLVGLRPGMAFDLTMLDEDDGLRWDVDTPDKE